MRIANVQFKIKHLDRAQNMQRIEGFVREAKQQGAQVVVFPEDCVTGSIFGDLSKLDRDQNNRNLFVDLARKHTIDIVTGSSMEQRSDGNFNTSYYVNARGEVLGEYRKNHLYPSEYKFLNPGTEAPVFQTDFGRAAIVICWDMLFAEIFERMKRQGVEIIYCPSYWYREIADAIPGRDPQSEESLLDALSLVRAVETNAVLVYCNAAGTMKNPDGSVDTLIGHSQIVVPGLGAIGRLDHHAEQMFIQDVDLATLVQSQMVYHG